MKSLTTLVQIILEDIENACGTSTTRDFETIARRVEDEGISFLTITLPSFGLDFERSLDQGKVASSSFHGFHRDKEGVLPRFLGGLLKLVFCSVSGVLLDKPNVCAINDIRQICLMFKKVELACTEKRTQDAYSKFVQTEHELLDAKSKMAPSLLKEFTELSRIIWTDQLRKSNGFVALNEKVCLL